MVFVADSQSARLDADVESMLDLRENLAELGTSLDGLPLVLQYNKHDIEGAEPVDRLRALLNPGGAPEVESAASRGVGVVETLQTAARLVLRRLAA